MDLLWRKMRICHSCQDFLPIVESELKRTNWTLYQYASIYILNIYFTIVIGIIILLTLMTSKNFFLCYGEGRLGVWYFILLWKILLMHFIMSYLFHSQLGLSILYITFLISRKKNNIFLVLENWIPSTNTPNKISTDWHQS